jgi:hypothetical protein
MTNIPSGWKAFDPEGVRAISRGLSEATPPENYA